MWIAFVRLLKNRELNFALFLMFCIVVADMLLKNHSLVDETSVVVSLNDFKSNNLLAHFVLAFFINSSKCSLFRVQEKIY